MAERLLMQLKHYKTNIQSIIPGFIRTQESIYLLQHTIRPDIVNVPEIEEPKVAKWKIALTVAVLLTLIAILSTVLISQLNEEDDISSFQTLTTREVQTDTKDVSHQSSTPTTIEVLRTSTYMTGQGSTIVELSTITNAYKNNSSLQTFVTSEVVQTTTKDDSHQSSTPTTTEVQTTSTPMTDQDSTLGMYKHFKHLHVYYY
ncbi:uncharacterized protein LOC144624697 [Crassostrea virginica]